MVDKLVKKIDNRPRPRPSFKHKRQRYLTRNYKLIKKKHRSTSTHATKKSFKRYSANLNQDTVQKRTTCYSYRLIDVVGNGHFGV